MTVERNSPYEIEGYIVQRSNHTSSSDTTNGIKYHYGLANDGTWIHWSSWMSTEGLVQNIRHESDQGMDVEAVNISADTVRESILRNLPDEDRIPDEEKSTYKYLRNNAQDIAADLVNVWQGMAEENVPAVGFENVGVGEDVLFANLREPWIREVRSVMDDHGIEETNPKTIIEPTVDILESALREGVKEVRKWYYPHAEYIVKFKE